MMGDSVVEDLKKDGGVEPEKEVVVAPSPIRIKEKRNSKDEKSRKKDEKSIDQILKHISDLDPEKKLNVVIKKYSEILDENRKLHLFVKMSEKKMLVIQREKDQCESERSKAVLTRSRLESLCRELQRQNKAIKEESMLKIREEEEKRKEVSAKFQSTLTEITALMTETNEKNVKLHEDNMDIHKKFKTVFEEMDAREKQFEEMHRVMKEELQATEARLAQVTLEMAEEKEKLLREKSAMLIKLTEYQKRIVELQHVEANLRSQVAMYTEKYADFQNALAKSQEVFGGFNSQMEKMSKKIIKLEKETNMWKSRWEKNNHALLDMATEKQTRDAEMVALNKKCALLQELCKTFQQERAKLITQLKEKSQNDKNETVEKGSNETEQLIVNGSVSSNKTDDKKVEEETSDVTPACPQTETNTNECCTNNEVENKQGRENSCPDVANVEDQKDVAPNATPNTEEQTVKEEQEQTVKEEQEQTVKEEQVQISEQPDLQNTVSSDAKEESKVEVTQDTDLNSVSNKKQKDGKKKRK